MIMMSSKSTARLIAAADAMTRRNPAGSQLRNAIGLYRKAFKLGNTTAGYNLACTYQNLESYRAAVLWYRRVLAAGDLSALVPLAQAELYGRGATRNVTAALTKLHRIARGRRWFT